MGALLLLTMLGVFVFRENILESLLNKYVQKLKANYNIELTYTDLQLNGIGEINLTGVVLAQTTDTLGNVDSISVTFPFWKTLFGNRKLSSLTVVNGQLYPFKYTAPTKDTNAITPTTAPQSKLERVKKLANKLNKLIPNEVQVINVNTHLNNKMGVNRFSMDTLQLKDGKLVFISTLTDEAGYKQPFNWVCNYNAGVWAIDYISDRAFEWKVRKGGIGFNTCSISLKMADNQLKCKAQVDSAIVEHYRIAEKPVVFNKTTLNFNIDAGDNRIDVYTSDSATFINGIAVNAKAFYDYDKSVKMGLNLTTKKQPATDYVNAIPPHIFKKIDKLQVKGDLSYAFNFELDMTQIDSLKFSSELTGYNFKVLNAAQLGLTKMNEPFMHTIKTATGTYEVGVGEGLPYFTPITQVPRHLIDAILTNEDPSFFQHRGFIESAVRESIIINIKERRFKRGASTISMQLVKNLFLSKEKTLARKIEEILLVWILENKHITPKERMFEVYLNIIEWGPGIYGINQAAEFYFKKKPQQLSLEESLYLASIIPRPKSFKYTFDKEGNIRPHQVEQFRFIKNLMVKRELITPQDTLGFNPNIQLKGEARKQVMPEEEGTLEKVEGFFENLF